MPSCKIALTSGSCTFNYTFVGQNRVAVHDLVILLLYNIVSCTTELEIKNKKYSHNFATLDMKL